MFLLLCNSLLIKSIIIILKIMIFILMVNSLLFWLIILNILSLSLYRMIVNFNKYLDENVIFELYCLGYFLKWWYRIVINIVIVNVLILFKIGNLVVKKLNNVIINVNDSLIIKCLFFNDVMSSVFFNSILVLFCCIFKYKFGMNNKVVIKLSCVIGIKDIN